ncbi:ergothioneine biosynthesis protein EgtB [Gilvimarinus sp. DA14]|uniref:ergothioneine biosynthesis protein EgtB n=1 Tax=Gilvimarinus sp. DA14 TaxID=2956798 RepID=UPI0020B8B669|nr:ergothioneine biosynthesis protein EgtB [Gilvimarinus sp. DA14]UTF60882.1 ergothioneine biosynthesis protein EgtB [Gilvimarinus sp. DA14]
MYRDNLAHTEQHLSDTFSRIRQRSLELVRGFSAEDLQIQSMPDASPGKWHLAHTTWFFDHFILRQHQSEYRPFNSSFDFLFNSYYDAVGSRHPRPERGLLSRPSLQEILDYRAHVDQALLSLLTPAAPSQQLQSLVITGLHHEMQHQELLLTDLKHALSRNWYALPELSAEPSTGNRDTSIAFSRFDETITQVGASAEGFSYDCEQPRHRVFLEPYELRHGLVSNREWLAFMADGGYQNPALWLSDGWTCCQQAKWQAPLYWQQTDDGWQELTFYGHQAVALDAPVCHISYYEADAFCRWAGWRLPTEFEWEHAARREAGITGHFAENEPWHPQGQACDGLSQMYGTVWEWTCSAFAPYPGFTPLQGALGEYNGKFMANQFVLKGGSCATPAEQMRHSYRNFFHPYQRWQFSGVRPARAAK